MDVHVVHPRHTGREPDHASGLVFQYPGKCGPKELLHGFVDLGLDWFRDRVGFATSWFVWRLTRPQISEPGSGRQPPSPPQS